MIRARENTPLLGTKHTPKVVCQCVHFWGNVLYPKSGHPVCPLSGTGGSQNMADEISSSSSSASTVTAAQTFRSELRSEFDREDINESSSFISYLKFALNSIICKEPLQLALNIIEEELTGHVEERATKLFGAKLSKSKGNAETEEKKEKRAKFVKDCTARRADGVFNMGNRVLDFLRAYQQGKLDKNFDYQILSSSSGQSVDPNTNVTLELVNSLPALDATMLANEQLWLSLHHPRRGLKSKAAALYDIVTRNDDVVIDLTTNEDIGKLSLSNPAKESFRNVLKDYKKARGNVDEEEQEEEEEVPGAATKRLRKQTDRFTSTVTSTPRSNTRNKKRKNIEAESLPIEAETLPKASIVENVPLSNKNKRTRRETGAEVDSGARSEATTAVGAIVPAINIAPTAIALEAFKPAAATIAAEANLVPAGTTALKTAITTEANLVTVAATDADPSVEATTAVGAIVPAVTIAPTATALEASIVKAAAANAAAAIIVPPAAEVTIGGPPVSIAAAESLPATPIAAEATVPALKTVITTEVNLVTVAATDADPSVEATTAVEATVRAVTIAPTAIALEASIVPAAAVANAAAAIIAPATPIAAEARTDVATETDPSVEAVISASAVADTTAETSAQIIQSISTYNPPFDELVVFSTAVVNQLQEKFKLFNKGSSLLAPLQNFIISQSGSGTSSNSQEAVLLSTESEVNISHSQSGSRTTSTPVEVALALVNILEESDIYIRNCILPSTKEISHLSIWIPKGMEDLSNRDNVMAICFVQAFILYSWPRQEKLQQFDRMKEIVRQLIALATAVDSSVTVEATARPAAAATVASTNADFFLSINEFVVDLGTIEIKDPIASSRRSSTSSQSDSIQMDCIHEAVTANVQKIPTERFNEKFLFSVQVMLNTTDFSTRRIPLSFPLVIGLEKVIFQLLAATFVKGKSTGKKTTLIRVINRYDGIHNCGRYINVNTDGLKRSKLDGGLLFSENSFSLTNLFFVKGNVCTQDEFKVAYKLKEEVLFISHSLPVSGDKLQEFIEKNECVGDEIIQSYCTRVLADFQKIEAIPALNPHQRSSIVFPVQFTNSINEILSRKTTTNEPISESEKKGLVEAYMNSLIGSSSLDESTILHVVVNLDNAHWNYLTVVFSTITICVWDSLISVVTFDGTKDALLKNLFTVFTWEYERRNQRKLSKAWERKDLIVLQQDEEPKVFCGVYCMVFLMRGFLEGLYSAVPFESDLDLSGDGNKYFLDKKLVRSLRASIADVILGNNTVLSIMTYFVEDYMYNSVHENLKHKHYFPCKNWLPEPARELFEPTYKLFKYT
jgi:hypothetical protein